LGSRITPRPPSSPARPGFAVDQEVRGDAERQAEDSDRVLDHAVGGRQVEGLAVPQQLTFGVVEPHGFCQPFETRLARQSVKPGNA